MTNHSKRGRVVRPVQKEEVVDVGNRSRCCSGRADIAGMVPEIGLGTGGCNTYGSI